jgi:hypothetical protein
MATVLTDLHIRRQAMYVQGNNGACSCNQCCIGKTISIAYSECAFAAIVIHHATRMRHIVICGLSGSTVYFHIISQTARFRGGLLNMKCEFWISLQILSESFLILRRIWRDMIKKVYWCTSTRYSCQILIKLVFSRKIFEKCSNIKFH